MVCSKEYAEVMKELRTTYKWKFCIVWDSEVSAKDLADMLKRWIASPSFIKKYFLTTKKW